MTELLALEELDLSHNGFYGEIRVQKLDTRGRSGGRRTDLDTAHIKQGLKQYRVVMSNACAVVSSSDIYCIILTRFSDALMYAISSTAAVLRASTSSGAYHHRVCTFSLRHPCLTTSYTTRGRPDTRQECNSTTWPKATSAQ